MMLKEVAQLLLKQANRFSWNSIKYPHFLITPTGRHLANAHANHCSWSGTCLSCNMRYIDGNLTLQRSHIRLYSQDTTVAGVTQNLNPTGLEKKRLEKKPPVVKILLINETGNYLETTLEDATKIARKKGLQLTLDNSESEHKHKDKKVYRLMTNAQHFGSDWKKSDSKTADKHKTRKEDKTMILKSRISEHDVLAKVKQIVKLAEKGHRVRVFIGQSASGDSDSIYKIIESNLSGSCKIEQKTAKGSEIAFKVVQSKEEQTTSSPEVEEEPVTDTINKKKKA